MAEAIGTFILVFAGCGAVVVNDLYDGSLGHTGISLVFGLVVMAVIYAIGSISGAHINPAVSLVFVMRRQLSVKDGVLYTAVQITGAVLAAAALKALFHGHADLGATVPASGAWHSFFLEVILTFFLVFVILGVSTGHKEVGVLAGVAVGGTVALDALVGGPVSGASMNPARSLGPALLSGEVTGLWVYLTAPFLGALLALLVFRLVSGWSGKTSRS
jgi:aquaporin Z